MRITVALVAAALTVGATAQNARAGTVVCRAVSASWNAPNGALITKRGNGVVTPVIDSAGEYRTHVMISKGTNGTSAHATMGTPATRSGCDHPIVWTELQQGQPGAQLMTAGATYASMYSSKEWNGIDSGTGTTFFAKWHDGGAKGAAAANYVDAMGKTNVASKGDATQSIVRLLHSDGQPINYELYQFMNINTTNVGGIGNGQTDPGYSGAPSLMQSHGDVCSTFISYLLNRAGHGVISTHTYTHTQTVNGGNALKTRVKSDCNNSLNFFEGTVFSSLYCGLSGDSACANAGDQARNCMAYGDCYDSKQGKYDNFVADSNKKSNTISPDRLAGYGAVHNVTTGTNKATSSPWAGTIQNDVVWNSGAAVVYSCSE
jgi:hypothetical protein